MSEIDQIVNNLWAEILFEAQRPVLMYQVNAQLPTLQERVNTPPQQVQFTPRARPTNH